MKTSKIVLLVLITVLVAVFFAFDLQQYLSLESMKAQQTAIAGYRQAHPQTLLEWVGRYHTWRRNA